MEGEALSIGDRVLVKDGTPAAAGDPLAVVVVFAVVVQVVSITWFSSATYRGTGALRVRFGRSIPLRLANGSRNGTIRPWLDDASCVRRRRGELRLVAQRVQYVFDACRAPRTPLATYTHNLARLRESTPSRSSVPSTGAAVA
jgi:hypothetical protein